MSIAQFKPCPGGGPSAAATKIFVTGDIFGNNNYQQTGDSYTASQFGLAGVERFSAGKTNSGNYSVNFLPPANSSSANETVAPTPQNFTAHWYGANGTEVANNTNLAAEVVRIEIWGI
jgi:hypothetical protein